MLQIMALILLLMAVLGRFEYERRLGYEWVWKLVFNAVAMAFIVVVTAKYQVPLPPMAFLFLFMLVWPVVERWSVTQPAAHGYMTDESQAKYQALRAGPKVTRKGWAITAGFYLLFIAVYLVCATALA